MTRLDIISLSAALAVAAPVRADVSVDIGELPPGKAVIVSHAVTVDSPTAATQISAQGGVTGSNFSAISSDDPDTAAVADATVTLVQQPPAVTDVDIDVTEDIEKVFAASEFAAGFSDPNGDALAVVRITSLPAKGTLELEGTPLGTPPVDVAAADLADLAYVPSENENGSDTFDWNASDGVDFAGSPASVNVAIAAVNDPPVAGADAVARHPSQSVKIPVAALLANDSDIEGNLPLTVTAVSSPTANGAAVTLGGSMIFYQPNGHDGADTFTYTLSDSGGATATGSVSVNLIEDDEASENLVSLDMRSDGAMAAVFAGIPGREYVIQSTDTLSPPDWTNRATVTADSKGRISFTDEPPLPSQRFYRTVHP